MFEEPIVVTRGSLSFEAMPVPQPSQRQRATWAYTTSNQVLKERIMELRSGSHIERQVDSYAINKLQEELRKLEAVNNSYLLENAAYEKELDGLCGDNAFETVAKHNQDVREQMGERIDALDQAKSRGRQDLMHEISDQITFLHQNNVLLAKANQLLRREVEDARELRRNLDQRYFHHMKAPPQDRLSFGQHVNNESTIWKIITAAAMIFALAAII